MPYITKFGRGSCWKAGEIDIRNFVQEGFPCTLHQCCRDLQQSHSRPPTNNIVKLHLLADQHGLFIIFNDNGCCTDSDNALHTSTPVENYCPYGGWMCVFRSNWLSGSSRIRTGLPIAAVPSGGYQCDFSSPAPFLRSDFGHPCAR